MLAAFKAHNPMVYAIVMAVLFPSSAARNVIKTQELAETRALQVFHQLLYGNSQLYNLGARSLNLVIFVRKASFLAYLHRLGLVADPDFVSRHLPDLEDINVPIFLRKLTLPGTSSSIVRMSTDNYNVARYCLFLLVKHVLLVCPFFCRRQPLFF